MEKLPPIEKIPEAYTVIEDERIALFEDYAKVKSSGGKREYLIKWKGNVYYSDDNSTYWQRYIGYPVIAVLMLKGKLSLNRKVSAFFKGVNWYQLNKKNERDYAKSLSAVLESVSSADKEEIHREINEVFEEIKNLDLVLTRKKNLI